MWHKTFEFHKNMFKTILILQFLCCYIWVKISHGSSMSFDFSALCCSFSSEEQDSAICVAGDSFL